MHLRDHETNSSKVVKTSHKKSTKKGKKEFRKLNLLNTVVKYSKAGNQ